MASAEEKRKIASAEEKRKRPAMTGAQSLAQALACLGQAPGSRAPASQPRMRSFLPAAAIKYSGEIRVRNTVEKYSWEIRVIDTVGRAAVGLGSGLTRAAF